MAKRFSTFRIKRNTLYTTAEAAKALSKKEQTVQSWIWREGLKVVENSIPRLILGQDIIDFINSRRKRRRRNVKPWQFLCFKCQLPRDPAFECVEIIRRYRSGGAHVTALCPECCRQMFRFADRAGMEELARRFETVNRADLEAQNDSKNDIVRRTKG